MTSKSVSGLHQNRGVTVRSLLYARGPAVAGDNRLSNATCLCTINCPMPIRPREMFICRLCSNSQWQTEWVPRSASDSGKAKPNTPDVKYVSKQSYQQSAISMPTARYWYRMSVYLSVCLSRSTRMWKRLHIASVFSLSGTRTLQ